MLEHLLMIFHHSLSIYSQNTKCISQIVFYLLFWFALGSKDELPKHKYWHFALLVELRFLLFVPVVALLRGEWYDSYIRGGLTLSPSATVWILQSQCYYTVPLRKLVQLLFISRRNFIHKTQIDQSWKKNFSSVFQIVSYSLLCLKEDFFKNTLIIAFCTGSKISLIL